jgi:hypothetical protein
VTIFKKHLSLILNLSLWRFLNLQLLLDELKDVLSMFSEYWCSRPSSSEHPPPSAPSNFSPPFPVVVEKCLKGGIEVGSVVKVYVLEK